MRIRYRRSKSWRWATYGARSMQSIHGKPEPKTEPKEKPATVKNLTDLKNPSAGKNLWISKNLWVSSQRARAQPHPLDNAGRGGTAQHH
jgi:hypothetical protein